MHLYCSHDNDDDPESDKSCRRHLLKKEHTSEQKNQAAKSQANYYERKKNDPQLVLQLIVNLTFACYQNMVTTCFC